jgi:hypothetical protein
MKTILLGSMLTAWVITQPAQYDIELPVNAQGKVEWSEVVNTDSVGKQQLLRRAARYMKKNTKFSKYTSSSEYAKAVRHDEFIHWGNNQSKFTCTYDVKIEVKEDRYKYTINNMVLEQEAKRAKPTPLPIDLTDLYKEYRSLLNQGKTKSKKLQNSFDICTSANNRVTEVIAELKAAMNEPAPDKDDW